VQRSVVTIAALAAVTTLFISSIAFAAAQRAAGPSSAGAHSSGSGHRGGWHGGGWHGRNAWHAGHVWHSHVRRPAAVVGGWGFYNDLFYYAAPDYFSQCYQRTRIETLYGVIWRPVRVC
jgi:hypothetical protein